MTAYNVSVLNQYLPNTVKFNDYQWQFFWRAVQQASRYLGSKGNTQSPAKQTAENWKAAHLQLSSADQASTGLGGLLRVDTVKAILKQKGYQIQHLKSAD